MANELKLAEAARAIATELTSLPEGSKHPFEKDRAFRSEDKAPCCAIGHVIHRAGLTDMVQGLTEWATCRKTYASSKAAVRDVCGVEMLPTFIARAVSDVVYANDMGLPPFCVAEKLYELADALEQSLAPGPEGVEG